MSPDLSENQSSNHLKAKVALAGIATLILLIGGGTTALVLKHKNPKTAVTREEAQVQTKKAVPPVQSQPSSKPTNSPNKVPASTAPVSPTNCYQVAGASTRSTTDLPDDNSGYQIHLLYILPSDGVDHMYDINGSIAKSVSAWQNWLCNQTGGKTLRLDMRNGVLDVTFIRLNASDNTIKTGSELPWSTDPNNNPYVREDIERRIIALGFTDPHKLYAAYYDGTSNHSCGGGAWPPTIASHFAAEYMHGGDPAYPNCETNHLATNIASPGYFDFDILHEIMHTLGFVATCAPHHNWGGHVGDNARDLMQAGQDWGISQGLLLDPGRDDYYATGNSSCLDLANSAFLTNGGSQLPPKW